MEWTNTCQFCGSRTSCLTHTHLPIHDVNHPTVPKLSEKGRVVAENRQISEGGFAFVYLVSWLDRMREMGDFYSSRCESIAIEKPTHQINGGVFIGKASINGGLSVATVGYQRLCSWLLVEGPTPKSQMFQVGEWRSLDAFDILQSW